MYQYIETELENWSDIFRINHNFFTRFVFRGQADSKWDLESSLERFIRKIYPGNIDSILYALEERLMLKEFKWKYPLYSKNIPEENDIVEWLTIMQHYGAPTRLLDFTYSLFIAVSFAIANSVADYSVVWAININKDPINSKSFDQYKQINNVIGVEQSILDSFILEQANNDLTYISLDKNQKKRLHIIKPKRCNERILRQQGLFLMSSDIQRSFNDHLRNYLSSEVPFKVEFKNIIDYSEQGAYKQDDISILKICIPNSLNFEIGKSLRAMNLTAEHLFPGLDGLAKSLTYLKFQGLHNK